MPGRSSEICFWRLFGVTLLMVMLVNIMVLWNGAENWRKVTESIHKTMIPVNTKELTLLGNQPVKRFPELSQTSSKIEEKKPLMVLSVVNLNKYFDNANVMALGRSRKKKGYLVLGVPTVYREKAYYLLDTIKSLVGNLPLKDRLNVVIVIFVSDFDISYRNKVVNDIKANYPSAINDGLIQVIHAPREYYPDFNNLTYGDKCNQVQWRSKQNLDYSFLYYYSAHLGQYYIQLADDVLSENEYFTKIKTYLEGRRDENWSTIEFGANGFIGMTYRTVHLQSLAKFARVYFWTMPIDYLFRIYNDIFLYGNSKKDIVYPPIFKNIREYSTPDEQVRKLEVTKRVYQIKEGNPLGTITTSITDYVIGHDINSAYNKEGYFWGKSITEGKYIEVVLTNPTVFSRIVIRSGSAPHPSDALLDSVLSISTEPYQGRCMNLRNVAKFKNAPVIDHTFNEKNKIHCVRLTIEKVREDKEKRAYWLIISEIVLS